MIKKFQYSVVISALLVMTATSCASHKGSSSLESVTKTTTVTKGGTPVVRADQMSSQANIKKQSEEARAAHDQAIEDAKASAKAAAEEAQRKLAEAKAQAEEIARQAKEEAEKQAAEAAAKAEEKAKEVVTKVTVREEQATVLETKTKQAGQYHVIVGSFKSLENARALCDKAVAQGYLPSIMENPDGMYRVSVFTADDEELSRQRLLEIVKANPEYVGSWLLKLK